MTVDSSVCPIVATMKMLGNQWNMIAIRYLHDEPMRYNQLRREMGNVSSKTLSRSLKHLAEEKIVERRVLGYLSSLSRIFANREREGAERRAL